MDHKHFWDPLPDPIRARFRFFNRPVQEHLCPDSPQGNLTEPLGAVESGEFGRVGGVFGLPFLRMVGTSTAGWWCDVVCNGWRVTGTVCVFAKARETPRGGKTDYRLTYI